MTTRVQALLRGCLVRLAAPGTAGGTGFLVAPGTVLTCAHVIAGAEGPVTATLAGRDMPARVTALHPAEPGSPYPYPDMALLEIEETDHPCVRLDTGEPRWDDRIYGAGFTDTWPGDEPTVESELFTFVGVHDADGPYLKLAAGQAVPGMSGGPLVNLRTMAVCGILKTTRHALAPYGGWGVPLGPLRELHPEVVASGDAFHRADARWREAADPIDPLLSGLSAVGADYASRIENFLVEYLGRPGHPTPFGGRDAQLAELTAWLRAPDATPYALVAAEAGRGKSALLVRWSQEVLRQQLATVIVIPVSIRFNTGHAAVVFSALATRLAQVHGESLSSAELSAEQWKEVCAGYLRRPPPGDRPLLVVVDGLDEATDWQAGPDLFPAVPARGVRVLASARYLAGDVDARGWLDRLNWPPPLAIGMALPPMDREGVAQVLTEMGDPLAHLACKVDVVSELFRLSEGDPLLIRLYVEALLPYGERAAAIRPDELPAIDRGLGGYFQRWWLEQERLWDEQGRNSSRERRDLQDVLNALSSSLGPLSLDDLAELLPEPMPGLVLGSLTRDVGRFVIGDGRTTGFVFSHPRLGMFFRDAMGTRERRTWDERFLEYGRRALESVKSGVTDVSPYPVRFLGAHLERAGAADEELYALLDQAWLRAWEALEGGDSGFLNDSERAWRRADTRSDARSFEVRVQCALIRSSVAARSDNIPPRLLVEAVSEGVITRAQAVALCRRISDENRRADAVIRLAPVLPAEWGEECVVIAGSLPRESSTAHVLAKIAAHLDERAVRRALAIARGSAAAGRFLAVAALAARLPGEERAALVAEVMAELPAMLAALRNDAARGRSLAALAAHLPGGRLGEAAALAEGLADRRAAVRALCAIARHLPSAERQEATRRAVEIAEAADLEITNAWGPVQTELALADLLPERRVPALKKLADLRRTLGHTIERQMIAARPWLGTVDAGDWPTAILTSLPYLPEHLMEELAPSLPAALRAWLQDPGTGRHLPNGGSWPSPLGTAYDLPEDVIPDAIAALSPVRPENRAWALAADGPHAPPEMVAAVLSEARESGPAHRAPMLTALALCHTGEDRRRLLSEALTTAQQIDDLQERIAALPLVMDELDEETVGVVQKMVFDANLNDRFTRSLLARPVAPAAVDSALALAHAANPLDRARTLIALTDKAPADRRAECREHATAALRDLPPPQRLEALERSVLDTPGLGDELAETLYSPEALATEGISYLIMILGRVTGKPAVLDHAVERLARLLFKEPEDPGSTIRGHLSYWLPRLPRDLPERALNALWRAAVATAPRSRAMAMALTAPRLPAEQVEDAVTAALEMARATWDDDAAEMLADGLTAVYANLPDEARLRTLHIALGPERNPFRLRPLAPHVAPEHRRHIIELAMELGTVEQAELYLILVRTYPVELTRPVLDAILRAGPSALPPLLLAELSRHVDAATAATLQDRIVESIRHRDVSTVRRLLRRLPEDRRVEAAERAFGSRRSPQDLAQMIKYLPEEVVPSLTERIGHIKPPADRLAPLGALVSRLGPRTPDPVWRTTLDAVEDFARPGKWGSNEILGFLRRKLPPMDDRWARAFTEAIRQCPDPGTCAAALAALAGHVSPEARAALLDAMFELVDAAPHARHTARILTETASVAAGNARATWRTLDAISRIQSDTGRRQALEALFPAIRKAAESAHSPPPEWDRALHLLSRRPRPIAGTDLAILVSGGAPLAPRPADLAAAYVHALRTAGEWWP
ncbi:serine protease [Actinomadura rubrisoli]|uniref:serine protease n=1 Tax=Actinomadura rubrisoli TaxID=2530368 RepID=UPI001405074D|nr:serine protease [Actinomadura rubrisoli]